VTHHMFTIIFFVPAQSAILPLCESEFNRMSTKGYVGPVNSPTAASVYSLSEGLLFYLAEAHSGLGLTTAFTGLPPVQVLLSQMTSDDFFHHNKGDANSFVRRDSTSPFRGQFISFFISRYSMMPGNPY